MSEREDMARTMHAAVTEKARAERANVAEWDALDRYYRDNFLRMADGVIAAGWSRGGSLFDLPAHVSADPSPTEAASQLERGVDAPNQDHADRSQG